jgi:hypothetical protein
MATQSNPPPLNSALLAVTAAAAAELDPLWQLAPTDIVGGLFDTLPALIDKWGLASASAAADWYDELRAAENIAGRFTAIVPPLDDLGAEALAGWGSQPLREPPVQNLDVVPPEQLIPLETARYRVEGGLQKRLVNAANITVTGSAAEDPQARGYMRRTRPGACDFCVMVASRGGVFTKASATFACHEHCYCEAIPSWGGKPLPVKPYKPSDRPSTPADRARVRKWIADNL